MASDQGLSIFDEPESADGKATSSGRTAGATAGEETQVLPVTPKDEPEARPQNTAARPTSPSTPATPAPAPTTTAEAAPNAPTSGQYSQLR